MKNPFIQRMPLRLDIRIRFCLLRAWWSRRSSKALWGGAFLAVPALAVLLFIIIPQGPVASERALVRAVQEAQQAELARSSEGIYHVTRVIREGKDKPSFVAQQAGGEVTAPPRVDIVTTWQHNDTALALIESNGTEQQLEVFLSRENDGLLELHHYAEGAQAVASERAVYDRAHDLASLYAEYTSLERPVIPVLPDEAILLEVLPDTGRALFVTQLTEEIVIESAVDLTTYLVVEETIYVTAETGDRFEMTRISYTGRDLVPAEQFDEIFDPTQYAYEIVTTS
jgi:hypothetical protein